MRDARREVRLATEARDGARAPVLVQTSPSGQVAAAEESAALRAVVAGLPEDQRTVVRLVHEEGVSLVEAGARTRQHGPSASDWFRSRESSTPVWAGPVQSGRPAKQMGSAQGQW